ncbi:nucleotidyltransferase family protein [Frankia canadensis]|uniref:nucleotidyltransferase family protein n=1 Tax=Frankia canadensis TaxID=1836972 RepID=UPI001FAFDB84|nr:nucleotidyltransferase domain-containing protein [Frankia canadensis]
MCRRYGVAELSVFGSVARGEDTDSSDVDLLSEAMEAAKSAAASHRPLAASRATARPVSAAPR